MKAHFDPQWPRWNNPICPRVSGFSDGVLHKVGLLSGQEEKRVYGGRIRVQAERFRAYEAQVERRLLTLAAPLLQEAGQLAAEVETGSPPAPTPPGTPARPPGSRPPGSGWSSWIAPCRTWSARPTARWTKPSAGPIPTCPNTPRHPVFLCWKRKFPG